MQKEKTKSESNHAGSPIFKRPSFFWTKELIAEFANHVAKEYKESDMWSNDLTCEKNMLDSFVKAKRYEKMNEGLVLNDTGKVLVVNKEKFEELINFLYYYQNDVY